MNSPLPASSELLARNKGADKGYVLVSGGHGIPVTITQDSAAAVHLTEVLSSEVPFGTLDAEIVGQLRQWRVDSFHLSAIHHWGYPMYWASKMDRARLEAVLTEQVENRVYPANQAAVFLVGAFFFSRRHELLDEFGGYLTPNSAQHVQRLRDAVDP